MKIGDLISVSNELDPAAGNLTAFLANLKKTDTISIVTVQLDETGILTWEEGNKIFVFLNEQKVEIVSNKNYWKVI